MSRAFDILMLVDNPLHSDRRVERQAKSLANAGWTVGILAVVDKGNEVGFKAQDGYWVNRCIPEYFLHPMRTTSYRNAENTLIDQLSALKFNVLYCHDYLLLPAAAKYKAKNLQCKLVYDSHEYLEGWPLYREIPSAFNRFKGYLTWRKMLANERQAMRMVDFLIAPSEGIRQLQANKIPMKKASCTLRNIPAQVDHATSEFKLRSKLDLSADDVLAVLSGNIYQTDKELTASLEALVTIGKVQIIIIGNRPRHTQIQDLCRAHPLLKHRVHFVNYDASLLHKQLSQCDVGIAFTRTEYLAHRIGSSNRLMEYTLAKLPILGTRQQSHEEMAKAFGHVQCFDPKSTESFKQGFLHILNDLAAFKAKAAAAAPQLNWPTEFAPVLAWLKENVPQSGNSQ